MSSLYKDSRLTIWHLKSWGAPSGQVSKRLSIPIMSDIFRFTWHNRAVNHSMVVTTLPVPCYIVSMYGFWCWYFPFVFSFGTRTARATCTNLRPQNQIRMDWLDDVYRSFAIKSHVLGTNVKLSPVIFIIFFIILLWLGLLCLFWRGKCKSTLTACR